MTRRHAFHALEQRLRRWDEAICQVLIQRASVERWDMKTGVKHRLHFGSEPQSRRRPPEVYRLYPQWISHEQEALPRHVPQCERKDAVEPRERVGTPRLVSVNNHLGVGAGTEVVA